MSAIQIESEAFDGAFLDATVCAFKGDYVEVELNGDVHATVPSHDWAVLPELGAQARVFVDQRLPGQNIYLASKERADRFGRLEELYEIFQKREVVTGQVVALAPGGFTVDLGVKAYLPASQFSLKPIRDPEEILGQSFRFLIIRFVKKRQNIVLSRRILLADERIEAVQALKVGMLVQGRVKTLIEYGAIVDLGKTDGFLHVSDMSWGRVDDPSSLVEVGELVTVKILKVETQKNRVSVGLRQAQENPWITVPERYPVGTVVLGKVVSKTDFGVFIELEPGVEGLVHATGSFVQEADRQFLRSVEIGVELEAKVLDVDVKQRRISLARALNTPLPAV